MTSVANQNPSDHFFIGSRRFSSRLLVGTGKYRTSTRPGGGRGQRRGDRHRRDPPHQHRPGPGEPNLLDVCRPSLHLLPNTAGCYTAEDACAPAGWRASCSTATTWSSSRCWATRRPCSRTSQTLAAAETLIKDGFKVMVYTNDDPIVAALEEMGCVAVMPLAAPIGSGLGYPQPLQHPHHRRERPVPILVDAGVGTASDAAIAMELGCDGVLMNTAIAGAQDPVLMASAMKKAVEAGREAFLAGRMPRKLFAECVVAAGRDVFLIRCDFLGIEVHRPGVGRLLMGPGRGRGRGPRTAYPALGSRRGADFLSGSLAQETPSQAPPGPAGIPAAGRLAPAARWAPAPGHGLAGLCRAHYGGAGRNAGPFRTRRRATRCVPPRASSGNPV
jgi:thiazole synthase